MNEIATIFRSLEGSWSLHRTISGHGVIRGFARFTQDRSDRNTYYFKEEGTFTHQTKTSTSVFREYVYKLDDEGVKVFFAKTPLQLMHLLQFSKIPDSIFPSRATAFHNCPPDTYTGEYTFISDRKFTLEYTVLGPLKKYTIFSIFTKESDT